MLTIEKIAAVFQNNIGNRVTVELANGMIQEINKILENDKPDLSTIHDDVKKVETK